MSLIEQPGVNEDTSSGSQSRPRGERRRILFVVTKMSQGGAMVLPIQIAAGLRDRGHDAEVWYLYKHSPAYEDQPGVRVLLPWEAKGIIDYLRAFWRLYVSMRRHRPDIVHGVVSLGNVFGLLSAALIGCRTRVASQHNPASTYNPIMRGLDLIFGTLGIYTSNIAVSRTVGASFDGYPERYRRRLHVIPNGVAGLRSNTTKAEARKHFGLPEQATILGSVGRLSEQKNQDFLFPVIERLPEVHLVLAGNGESRAAFSQQLERTGLSQRVRLLGSVEARDIPRFLAAIDLFVLPSRYEGMPLALLEAMQAGLPIVASDIPSVREVMDTPDQDPTGLCLPIESDQVWAEAIHNLLNDDTQLRQFSEAARRRGEEFSLDRMVDRYETCLTQDAG
jgi:glycosyltransferase involved in cell wall biosynthesis